MLNFIVVIVCVLLVLRMCVIFVFFVTYSIFGTMELFLRGGVVSMMCLYLVIFVGIVSMSVVFGNIVVLFGMYSLIVLIGFDTRR